MRMMLLLMYVLLLLVLQYATNYIINLYAYNVRVLYRAMIL